MANTDKAFVIPIRKKRKGGNKVIPILIGVTAVTLVGILSHRIFDSCTVGQRKIKLVFCDFYRSFGDVPANDLPDGEFTYGGSTSLLKLADPAKQTISQIHPNFVLQFKQLDIADSSSESGDVVAWSGEGIQELIDGKLDISFSSRDLIDEELDLASEKGLVLESIPVAKSGLAFFVAERNSGVIQSLTTQQLKDIYTLQDLSALEIPELGEVEVKPYSPDPLSNPERPEYFQNDFLEGKNFSSNVSGYTVGNRITDFIQEVRDAEGLGIGFADASIVCPETTIQDIGIRKGNGGPVFLPCIDGNPSKPNDITISDGSYPLARQLFVIIRRDGTATEKAGEAYVNMLLSDEGQALVKQVGYVPVRDSM